MTNLEKAVKEFLQIFTERDLTAPECVRQARVILRQNRLDPSSSGTDFANLLALQIEDLTEKLDPKKKRILNGVIERLR
jgi:hypothetical protein